jgi:hypothetical protein
MDRLTDVSKDNEGDFEVIRRDGRLFYSPDIATVLAQVAHKDAQLDCTALIVTAIFSQPIKHQKGFCTALWYSHSLQTLHSVR